ncbi:hypothetical protein ACWDTR_18585 [Streptomyces sp. NPDC003470]
MDFGATGGPGEGVDQRPVGQAEQAARGLGGQPRLHRVLPGVPLDLLGEARAQPCPVAGVGQPVPGDGLGGRGHSHREQFRTPDEPAPPELGRAVRASGRRGQLLGAGAAGAPPGQRWRTHVEDGHRAGDAGAARFAQDGAVTDAQGQRAAQRQPRGVRAQRADGHRHRGRPDVQRRVPGQFGDRFPGDADVGQRGEQPAVR